jgi:hypothetical protein
VINVLHVKLATLLHLEDVYGNIHLFAPSVRDSHCSRHEQSVDESKTHFEEWNEVKL